MFAVGREKGKAISVLLGRATGELGAWHQGQADEAALRHRASRGRGVPPTPAPRHNAGVQ